MILPSELSFHTLLRQMDMREMAKHSTLNHHVTGMNYLCLHRSDAVTIKLYLIEEPRNTNNGYLVSPHSHRYAFHTRVLYGTLHHIRFQEVAPAHSQVWDKFTYTPEDRSRVLERKCGLQIKTATLQDRGSEYFVDETEIHTLLMAERHGPVLLGLTQFRDVRPTSELYLPMEECGDMQYPKARTAHVEQVLALRNRCLQLLEKP